MQKGKNMKRLFAILISAIMLFSCVTAVSAEEKVWPVMEQLAGYTPQERASLIAYIRPFVTTEAGVEAALLNLESNSFNGMIGNMFGEDMDKETVRRIFLSFNCIPDVSQLRLTYADIFQNKTELPNADANVLSGMQILADAMCRRSPEMKKIFAEDGITAGVIANLATILPAINGDKAILQYSAGNGFAVNHIDASFRQSFDAVWEGHTTAAGESVTYEKLMENLARYLNQSVSGIDAGTVANALQKLGVCAPATASGTDGPNVAGGFETPLYTVRDSMGGITAESLGGVLVQVKDTAEEVIKFETTMASPMIYKVDSGALVPVVFSAAFANGIRAQVTPGGVYLIRTEAYPFSDAQGWGKPFISALYNRGVISGRTKTTFDPDAGITREEFVKLIVSLFATIDGEAAVPFTDVQPGAWYYSYVASAYQNRIVSGVSETLFGTGQNIKRQDMAKIICTVLETKGMELPQNSGASVKDLNTVSDYAKQHVLAAYDMGILSGDDQGNFNPHRFATRQEAAKMICGMLTVYLDTLGA